MKEFTNEELKAEMARRDAIEVNEEREKRLESVRKVVLHKDVLLEFIGHSRGSCDGFGNNAGYHPEHGGAYCPRCALEDLALYDDNVYVSVDLTIYRTK